MCKIAESYPQDESKAAGLWNLESVFPVLSFLHLSSPNNSEKKTEVCVPSKYGKMKFLQNLSLTTLFVL